MESRKIIIISGAAIAIVLVIMILIIVGFTVGFSKCTTKDPRMTTDYCRRNLCPADVKHIGCANCMTFPGWRKCKRPSILALSSDQIKAIVHKHNELRNKIASGDLPPFKAAERMPTLKWNHELEFLAELNVRQCKMNPDNCRNTDKIPMAGQNLALIYSSIPWDKDAIIIGLIEAWFSEYKVTKPSDIESYPIGNHADDIRNFTTMIQDANTLIGCGVAVYIPDSYVKERALLLACNYGYNNVPGKPVYKAGTQCSKCSTGCNTPQYPALCNVEEVIEAT